MARIHGKNGQFNRYDLTGSPTTVTPVGDIKAWTLDMSTDKVDVTAFGDTNKQTVIGLPNFSGTFSGFWNSVTSPDLFDIILGGAAIGLKLVPNTAEATHYFNGLAYLDGNINVDSAGAVTVAGTFVAAGNWAIAP